MVISSLLHFFSKDTSQFDGESTENRKRHRRTQPRMKCVTAFTLAGSVAAFTSPGIRSSTPNLISSTARHSSVLEAPTASTETVEATGEDAPTAWECNEEAECVEVPACDEEDCRTTLDVRIHSKWYDLSGWRKAHPAGAHWIDWYDGRDATEVMDAFHSAKGREMYKRLPASDEKTAAVLDATVAPYSQTEINFRKLRDQLEADGWWDRDFVHEGTLLAIWASLVVGASATASSAPPLSCFLLALSMTNAGWLGHDYIHGGKFHASSYLPTLSHRIVVSCRTLSHANASVDKFANTMRQFTAVAAGLGPTWWSDKHNKHHALTNEMGVDEDIATDPFLFTWAPDPKYDSPLRKIQRKILFSLVHGSMIMYASH